MPTAAETSLINQINDQKNLPREIWLKGHVVNLDKKVEVSTTFGKKSLTLREYLVAMVTTDFKKAKGIYDVLIDPQDSNLRDFLSVHRDPIFKQRKTTGEKIFDQVSAPRIIKLPKVSKTAKADYKDVKAEKYNADELPDTLELDTNIDTNRLMEVSRYGINEPNSNPAQYRRVIYTDFASLDPITLKQVDAADIQPVKGDQDLKDQKFVKAFQVNELIIPNQVGKFIPLLTLTPNDRITEFTANFKYELGYSNKTHQYYVKVLESPKGGVCYVDYKLHQGQKPERAGYFPRNDKYLEALEQCSFKVVNGQLALDKGNLAIFNDLKLEQKFYAISIFLENFFDVNLSKHVKDGSIEALNLMVAENTGVCRHRAILFLAFAKVLNIPNVNVVANGMHVTVEAHANDGRVLAYDLGGGYADVTFKPPAASYSGLGGSFDSPIISEVKPRPDGRMGIVFNDKVDLKSAFDQKTNRAARVAAWLAILKSSGVSDEPKSYGSRNNKYVEIDDPVKAAEILEKMLYAEKENIDSNCQDAGSCESMFEKLQAMISKLDPENKRPAMIKNSDVRDDEGPKNEATRTRLSL